MSGEWIRLEKDASLMEAGSFNKTSSLWKWSTYGRYWSFMADIKEQSTRNSQIVGIDTKFKWENDKGEYFANYSNGSKNEKRRYNG